jgi:molecular chaperone DnaK
MAKEAESHAAEDKAKRDEIEARNQLDSMVYNIEKMLREHGDKISGDEKGNVESALAEAKKALEGTDTAAMNAARDRLTQASHKLAEAMYKSAQGQPGAAPTDGQAQSAPGAGGGNGAAGQQQKKDEGVIDAEYVDVDEKK